MTDFLNICLTSEQIGAVSNLGLAHIGDCVYELLVRSYLVCRGTQTNQELHRATVSFVSAPAQARAMERLLPLLTEQESAVYRRGRNTRVNSVPKNAALRDYHAATGLETLFGWLYLNGAHARINELFAAALADGEQEKDTTDAS